MASTTAPGESARLAPNARLLSNGRMTTLVTEAGTGFTRIGGVALTRWSGDRVEDAEGWFFYLRDVETHELWSIGAQPCATPEDPDLQRAAGAGRASLWFEASVHGILAHVEVLVHPERDMELRSVVVTNLSGRSRLLELTGWLEVALDRPAAVDAHPALSKLFVRTEHDAASGALLAHRRARSDGDTPLWLVNAVAGGSEPQFDTERAAFLGRGGCLCHPQGVAQPLAGRADDVLDAALALRRTLALGVGEQARLVFMLGAADTRDSALALAAALPTLDLPAALAGAQRRETGLLERAGLSSSQAGYYHQLAAAMLYGQSALRAGAAAPPRRSADGVRADGAQAEDADAGSIAPEGGLLAVVHSAGPDDLMLQALLSARRMWAAKGLPVAMLVIDEHGNEVAAQDGVRVRRSRDFAPGALARHERMAQMVVRGHLPGVARPDGGMALPPGRRIPVPEHAPLPPREALDFFNGYGGFNRAGDEYVIRLDWEARAHRLRQPPRAWSNVIANETFGCIVGETGAAWTWSRNSRLRRLTPWSNDPVADPHGEALYVRDEATGEYWSPVPGPAPAAAPYETAHGFGYSRFAHASHGLRHETLVCVPRADPLKLVRVTVTNDSGRPRRLSLFSYQRLVLGETPADARHVVTGYDAAGGALLATSTDAGAFADGVVFAAAGAPAAQALHFSADRATFLGRHGSPQRPAALMLPALDHAAGAGLDPCAAFQAVHDLAPGATLACVFVLGEASSREDALDLVRRYRQPDAVDAALRDVAAFWRATLGAVRVSTPVKAIDAVMNGWLAYQALACRMWARSAPYQSGGAFGFRDQLQDAAALVHCRPDLLRRQIRLHAAHQFEEGDVTHWWHPTPVERGLRSRCSDDACWLPYVTAWYLRTTGDLGLLDEVEPFVAARALAPGEDEACLPLARSDSAADIYEHCCRALDRALTRGPHGLPLMGTGDWNDGMDRVGRAGRGESVWLGFFLVRVLRDFLPYCAQRRDTSRVKMYTDYLDELLRALDGAGWDGAWYRRAYHDDGTPLGSRRSDECRIDAIAQAWAVLSAAAPPDRARQALDALEAQLVSEQDGVIRLLTPPFADTPHDPGYIKAYPPGVRENGGQYTHAACWVVQALARAGRRQRAARLLAMLSPVSHARDAEAVERYQVEPYVVAADIAGAPPHVGRGGWTWYTGSAAWLYRAGLESVLGCTIENGDTLVIAPCIPDDWPEFHVHYTLPCGATYDVAVRNPNGTAAKVIAAALDGVPLNLASGQARIPLIRDGRPHAVEILLGSA